VGLLIFQLSTTEVSSALDHKNKVMCLINSFAIVYFFFDDRQQTAWSQGSSKYQKQFRLT
jgi:hypothetical protein